MRKIKSRCDVKPTIAFRTAFLLFIFFVSIISQSFWKTISCQLESSEVNFLNMSEATAFFNFTSDHLFIDDEGDWCSQGIDTKRLYVACDDQFIYIRWVKSLIGSHLDELYFDVGEKTGYPMETMNATYMFASVGLYKWNGTDFQLLIPLKNVGINFWKSDDNRVAYCTSFDQFKNEECRELKVAWSVFGPSQVVKIVDRIKYAGSDQAPDGTFVLIYHNQSQRYIISFYAKTSEFESRLWEIRKQSIGYYSEGFNASLKIMNFGNSRSTLNISINLPTGLFASLNETSWSIVLETNETWNQKFKIIPERLGIFKLTAMISGESASAFFLDIPLNLFVIPKMSVGIHHSGQMKAGFPNELNITVVNYEKINAEVSITTYGQYTEYWYFHPLTLEISPNSSVKVMSEITPLAIINPIDTYYNYSFLEMALQYENLPICSSGSFPFPSGPIVIQEPNVQIILNHPKEVLINEIFYVNISAVNKENGEIKASFKVSVKAFSQELVLENGNYKEQTVSISPNSSITASFKFKAVKATPWKAYVNLFVRHGILGNDYYVRIKVINLLDRFWPLVLYALGAVFFIVAVIGLTFLYRKKKKNERLAFY